MCSSNQEITLPELILQLEMAEDTYEATLFESFRKDFPSDELFIGKHRIGIEAKPWTNGRHRTFWHLISEGEDELTRKVVPCRCERIRWPKYMIQYAPRFKSWRNERGGRRNLLIALEDFSYVVVLAERRGHFFLWSAYCVEFRSRRAAMKKEHDAYQAKRVG